MNKSKGNVILIILASFFLLNIFSIRSLAATGLSSRMKVAMLHFGNIEDYGWTYEAHKGAQEMAKALPFVELSERERACGPDALQILRRYAEAENKIIFCHSFDFGTHLEAVAEVYPEVIFMWGGGVTKIGTNVGIYFGRMYEVKYLAGIVAGATTKSNKIGYAAALPTSEVIRNINAFARGASLVNAKAKVYVKWIGAWYETNKEREITHSLIDMGSDIMTHHSDSYISAQVAEERNVYFISFGSDMARFAPHVNLTGTVWNWAPIMIDIVKAVHAEAWQQQLGRDWWYGIAQAGIKLLPFSNVLPNGVIELVEMKRKAIVDGKLQVFPGMEDWDLRNMDYFESNVIIKP